MDSEKEPEGVLALHPAISAKALLSAQHFLEIAVNIAKRLPTHAAIGRSASVLLFGQAAETRKVRSVFEYRMTRIGAVFEKGDDRVAFFLIFSKTCQPAAFPTFSGR